MRDPHRIDRTLILLRAIWLKDPDLRLGQILATASEGAEKNLFYHEDSQLEAELIALWRQHFR